VRRVGPPGGPDGPETPDALAEHRVVGFELQAQDAQRLREAGLERRACDEPMQGGARQLSLLDVPGQVHRQRRGKAHALGARPDWINDIVTVRTGEGRPTGRVVGGLHFSGVVS
jgi:hypothetical protein